MKHDSSKLNKSDKNTQKILDAKKRIKEEKEKIKIGKRNIRKKKLKKFKKTRLGKIFSKVFFFWDDKNNYSFSELFVATIVSLVLGFFGCLSAVAILSGGRNFFKMSRQLDKFYDVYDVILNNYYGAVDKNELIEAAIDGMVSSVGDVYTSYNDVKATDTFNELVSGTYEGIGCTITKIDEGIKIVDIYEDSPASKADLRTDDIIVSVDDKDTTGDVSVNDLANYIRNEAKGKIKIKIIRDEETLEVVLERDNIEIPSINAEVYEKNDKKIGYISISIFSSVSAKQFKDKLESLEKEQIDGLVIDVRNNSGGYLSSVTDIASYLLPKGKVIYQVQSSKRKKVTKDKTNEKREYPIAIIVNGNSASASEILAGVIKESYGGYVVGTKTFGKGTVQQVKQLADGSMIKYTIENWLTPDGNWINEKGIVPTDEVKLDEEYYNDPKVETDKQLQKALELVSQ